MMVRELERTGFLEAYYATARLLAPKEVIGGIARAKDPLAAWHPDAAPGRWP